MKFLEKNKKNIVGINLVLFSSLIISIFFKLEFGKGDAILWGLNGYLMPLFLLPLVVLKGFKVTKEKPKNIVNLIISILLIVFVILFTTMDFIGIKNYAITTILYIIMPIVLLALT